MATSDTTPGWVSSSLLVGLVGIAAIRLATVYGDLPARMATHFGPSGAADGFMPRDGFVTFMAMLIPGVAFLLLLLPPLLRAMPGAINLPNRDYWLAPERRDATIARLSRWLRWFALPVTALLVLVNELTLRANLGHHGLEMLPFGVGLAAYLAINVFLVVGLFRAFRIPGGGSSPRTV